MKNGIIIGSFQPFHNGHVALFDAAIASCGNVHVIITNEDDNISINKFWPSKVVASFIKELYPTVKTTVISIPKYNEINAQAKVAHIIRRYENPIIFTREHDSLSYGLEKIYGISSHIVGATPPIDSEAVRHKILTNTYGSNMHLAQVMPSYIANRINEWIKTDTFIELARDKAFQIEYAKTSKNYDSFFVTADVILKHGNNVLLIERGKNPGKGQLAFPGGFVDINERVYDAALRELYEETSINIPVHRLKLRLAKSGVYDDPNRSLRGRVITHAFMFDVTDIPLSDITIKAADDAAKVGWYDIRGALNRSMFEDHADILSDLVYSSPSF